MYPFAAVLLATAAAGLPSALMSSEIHTPRMTVLQTADPILLDGLADDAAWERGVLSYGFLRVEDGKLPSAETRVRLLYDRKNLYVAFTALEPDLDSLRARASRRDAKVQEDDAVGLNLLLPAEGGATRVVEIWINSNNVVFDADSTRRGARWNLDGLETAVTKRKGSWDAELIIPFSGLGTDEPLPGHVWQVNFFRHRSGNRERKAEMSVCFDPQANGEIRFGRDLLVYLWSQRPFTGRDEIMVYNDSHVLRLLNAQVIHADSGDVVSEQNIYIGPGHRRQHFPLPAPEAGEYYVMVRQVDRPMDADDDKLVVWRPHWIGKK